MNDEILTIPTQFLPENWIAETADKFGLAAVTIRKVASGERKNKAVFDHLLTLAEDGKKAEIVRLERLEQLRQPLSASSHE